MAKKTIKLTESELNALVVKSVKKMLNENFNSEGVYDYLNDLKDRLGCETLLNEIVGKIDALNLYKILQEIDELYPNEQS